MPDASVMEQIVSLCKRRGFIYPASEIYGGLNGFWDYGPLGVLLKNNIRDWWWHEHGPLPAARPRWPSHRNGRPRFLDHSKSQDLGRLRPRRGVFSDPMVDCRESKQRYRADHLRVLGYAPEADTGMLFAFVQGDEESIERARRSSKNATRSRFRRLKPLIVR